MDDTRRQRLATRITHEVSTLVAQGAVKDPRVSNMFSFTYCKVAKDGTVARLGVSSFLPESDIERAVEGLNSAAGFIQGRLERVLKMRVTPRVYFVADHSIADAQRIVHTIEELTEEHAEQRSAD